MLILDEVITGWGRTGAKFAIDHWGVVPDMICTGKGIGSGYAPLAATIIHQKVIRAIEAPGRSIAGFTYGGSPLSWAVGEAVLSYITSNHLDATVFKPPLTTPSEDVAKMLDILRETIEEVAKELPV